VSFGAGITLNSFRVDNSTQISANITITGTATPGARDVSVVTEGGTGVLASGFMVTEAAIIIISISPTQGIQDQALSVTIIGTHFTDATLVAFGSGIIVNSFAVDSSTQITAYITITSSAIPGARDVSVTVPAGTATLTDGFTVNQASPTISSVSPSQGVQGQTLNTTITGTYLNGATSLSFGSDLTVGNFTVDSATRITASITISSYATTGAREVSVTTPGGTAVMTDIFTVNQAPPTISTVSPGSGIQGQTLNVTINGTYFSGASSVSFG